jgi:hypothetical protein
MCGYLNAFSPYGSGMFFSPWEQRYFTLTDGILEYFKSEKDTMFLPRGRFNVRVSALCTPAEQWPLRAAGALACR